MLNELRKIGIEETILKGATIHDVQDEHNKETMIIEKNGIVMRIITIYDFDKVVGMYIDFAPKRHPSDKYYERMILWIY